MTACQKVREHFNSTEIMTAHSTVDPDRHPRLTRPTLPKSPIAMVSVTGMYLSRKNDCGAS
jgi:hypothetical protein